MMSLKVITYKEAQALIDDELISRISEDGTGILNPEYGYMEIQINKNPIGFWVYHYTSSSTLHIHINIINKFRADNAMNAGWFFLSYIFSSLSGVERVECEIPSCYMDVIKFTKKFGFTVEGIKRNAVIRNKKLQDVQMLGLLRSEYNGCC